MAARYHPDKHRNNALEDLAREKLTEVNAAYDVLKDEQRRKMYDLSRQGTPYTSQRPPSPQKTLDLGEMIRSFIRLIVVLVIVFFALRFIRSPRAILLIGIVILVAWFLPRWLRKLKGPR